MRWDFVENTHFANDPKIQTKCRNVLWNNCLAVYGVEQFYDFKSWIFVNGPKRFYYTSALTLCQFLTFASKSTQKIPVSQWIKRVIPAMRHILIYECKNVTVIRQFNKQFADRYTQEARAIIFYNDKWIPTLFLCLLRSDNFLCGRNVQVNWNQFGNVPVFVPKQSRYKRRIETLRNAELSSNRTSHSIENISNDAFVGVVRPRGRRRRSRRSGFETAKRSEFFKFRTARAQSARLVENHENPINKHRIERKGCTFFSSRVIFSLLASGNFESGYGEQRLFRTGFSYASHTI